MNSGFFVLGVVFLVFVAPFWVIMHYMTKWKATKGLSDEEQRMLEELWHDSQRLSDRLSALETILESEAPSWRSKSERREPY